MRDIFVDLSNASRLNELIQLQLSLSILQYYNAGLSHNKHG